MIIKKLFDDAKKERTEELYYNIGEIRSKIDVLEVQLEFYEDGKKGFERRIVKTIFDTIKILLKIMLTFPLTIIKEEYRKVRNKNENN